MLEICFSTSTHHFKIKRMKKGIVLLIIILVSFQNGHSCSWAWTSFCSTLNTNSEDIVVSGQITGADEDGIDLQILSVLKGHEDRTFIRIWDGTDFDCNGLHKMNATLLGFPGDSIIVILPKIDSLENTWDVIGDYRMPFPYGRSPWVRVEDNTVLYSGGIKVEYQSFIENLCESEYWEVLVNSHEIEELQFKIYPNPTNDYCNIELDRAKGETELSVYDVYGKKVLIMDLNSLKTQIQINTFPTGTYFAIISREGKIIASERIIKF